MSSSKVRPAWADSSARESAQAEEETVSTAAPEAHDAPEQEYDEQPTTTEPSQEATGDIPGEHRDAFEAGREEPSDNHDGHLSGGNSAAPSFGKTNMDGEAHQETTYPRPVSSAPTGIKAAISSFMERISGERPAPSSAPAPMQVAPERAVPAGGEAAAGSKTDSPQEIEREVLRSLRDTGIEGFCRVAFNSPKGGVGKSSMAYAVAGAIAYFTNLRVCLVDADPDFGATRYMVPHPVEHSVLDLAEDAEKLERLADLRGYVSQNKHMGLDIILNPVEAAQISTVEDLAAAYERVDSVLSQFYDLVVFDLGSGFRDEAIRRLLSLSDELVLVSDSEKIPNAQLPDALNYVEGLGIDLSRTTLCINHGRKPSEESKDTAQLRDEHSNRLRYITEVEYDPDFSRLLNDCEFHPAQLALMTRLGVLTTAGVCLKGLRRDAYQRAREKVISIGSENGHRATSMHPDHNGQKKGGR